MARAAGVERRDVMAPSISSLAPPTQRYSHFRIGKAPNYSPPARNTPIGFSWFVATYIRIAAI
jgi:hypothetical protein